MEIWNLMKWKMFMNFTLQHYVFSCVLFVCWEECTEELIDSICFRGVESIDQDGDMVMM